MSSTGVDKKEFRRAMVELKFSASREDIDALFDSRDRTVKLPVAVAAQRPTDSATRLEAALRARTGQVRLGRSHQEAVPLP